MKKLSVSFIIPTFNDETTIRAVIERATSVAQKHCDHYEIVVLNDASIDKTPAILKTLSQKNKNIRLLHHNKNKGYGASIKELYYAAKQPWLFSLPGDFQIDPAEIIKLFPAAQDADMVIGLREQRSDAWTRQLQSKTYNQLLRLLLKLPIHDVNSVRLMKTSMLQRISLTSTTAFVDAELVLKAHKEKWNIKEIPIIHKPRTGGVGTGGKVFVTILPTFVDLMRCTFTSLR